MGDRKENAVSALRVRGNDGLLRDLDEHYDGKADVEADPYGAWLAIQNLCARLAEVEKERDDLQRMINGKTFAIEVSGSAEFEQMKQERDEARARVAYAYEEAAFDIEQWGKLIDASGKDVAPQVRTAIRALARPEETDALDRLLQKAREEERALQELSDLGQEFDAAIREDKT